jgi:conjugative transfer signal peptidase TraF
VTARVGLLAAMAIAFIAAPSLIDLPMKLIWNASPSVPTGLYWLRPGSDLRVGDLVVVAAPAALADFLAKRGYLPTGVPLLKHVAALPGQVVCRTGLTITIDDVVAGQALHSDRLGRVLPVWRGCQRVQHGDIFLMNVSVPNSLDGRYFGPTSQQSISGRALPIWLADAAVAASEARSSPLALHTNPSVHNPPEE